MSVEPIPAERTHNHQVFCSWCQKVTQEGILPRTDTVCDSCYDAEIKKLDALKDEESGVNANASQPQGKTSEAPEWEQPVNTYGSGVTGRKDGQF